MNNIRRKLPKGVTRYEDHDDSWLSYEGFEITLTSRLGSPVYEVSVQIPKGHTQGLGCRKSYDRGLSDAVDFVDAYIDELRERDRLEMERLAA